MPYLCPTNNPKPITHEKPTFLPFSRRSLPAVRLATSKEALSRRSFSEGGHKLHACAIHVQPQAPDNQSKAPNCTAHVQCAFAPQIIKYALNIGASRSPLI